LADDLNENEIKAFRIADNKVSERSYWDNEKLKDEILHLDLHSDIDLNTLGFLDHELEEILSPKEENFIDDLESEEFAENQELNHFGITFIFPIKNKKEIDKYIKKNGKSSIVEKIISLSKE
jgi:hypothetical protein